MLVGRHAAAFAELTAKTPKPAPARALHIRRTMRRTTWLLTVVCTLAASNGCAVSTEEGARSSDSAMTQEEKAGWRAQHPAEGIPEGKRTRDVSAAAYGAVRTVEDLVVLERELLVVMRTTPNPSAAYADAEGHVNDIGDGRLRGLFRRFVVGESGRGGRYSALVFSRHLRSSSSLGWAPEAYSGQEPNTIGEARGFEDYHAYDWLLDPVHVARYGSIEAVMRANFCFDESRGMRAMRLAHNAYRIPYEMLDGYLRAINAWQDIDIDEDDGGGDISACIAARPTR